MKINAYFCEWEDYNDDLEMTGCITYPVTITTESAASSYGAPVVLIDGEPRGAGDMPPGELQIPEDIYATITPKLKEQGYLVCGQPVNIRWLECWEKAEAVSHWHPDARLVQF